MGEPAPAALIVAAPSGQILAEAGGGVAARSLLTAAELARADALRRPEDRRDFVAAHVLVRRCAGPLLGRPAEAVVVAQRCGRCGGPHGRPGVVGGPPVHLSLSHTRGQVAAAAGTGPVGVDVELAGRGGVRRELEGAVLSPREIDAVRAAPVPDLAFLRQWVRKEALVKLGLATLEELPATDLSELPVGEDGTRPYVRARRWRGWHVLDWYDPRHRAVGAAATRDPPRLVHGAFHEPARR